MKQFFITLLACLAAMFVGFFLICFVVLSFITSIMMSSMSANKANVKPNSVLKIELSEIITDEPTSSIFGGFDPSTFTVIPNITMLEIITAIEAAQDDNNISGIYLRIAPEMSVGMANAQELRSALEKFRKSGKFVISYNDTYTQSTYYLSSAADKIFINPQGNMDWIGMSSQVLFFKGALDKLGIVPEIVRCGEFKSAVEPFINDRMSPESRLQIERLIGNVWGGVVSDIAASRGLDSADLQRYASDLSINGASAAVKYGLVDSAVYADQVSDYFKGILHIDELNFVPLAKYAGLSRNLSGATSKNKIAVIYADGDITEGISIDGKVGSKTLSQRLASARKNEDVKAVVMRINSPGGSALASEIIWREMMLLQQEKPVIVSMGNYAASGGYYIAAPGDVIIANKATITGSIGVFGIMFDAKKALGDKLGITVDVARTNTSSDMPTIFRAMTSPERQFMQNRVDSIYKTFVSHVANGRNLSPDKVLGIAEGRVWSGTDAQANGLVDGYGGIRDAILLAAERAGVSNDYHIDTFSEKADPFSQLMMSLMGVASSVVKSRTPDMVKECDDIMEVINRQGIQAAMPFRMTIK